MKSRIGLGKLRRMCTAANPQKIAAALNSNPELASKFVNYLAPEIRRQLAVLTVSRDVETVKSIDLNLDGKISKWEFEHWLHRTSQQIESIHPDPNPRAVELPSKRQLRLAALTTGIPYVGFGFLDNCILICAGESIDRTVGAALGLSVLASAALGNTLSDVSALGLGSMVETAANKLGLPQPNMSYEQSHLPITRRFVKFGQLLGIIIGCILGMFPLLLLGEDKANKLKELAVDLSVESTHHY
eukprot:TRINITY_DN2548_c0_g1_i4.p1 TRINITY_DN2548_c0_g1~~TRINITY_DN2548_c0_g1_i4.p1  ORF type:complete len:244 (+),score=24.12 TRINITY_DN2548_c0_g1_i4:435-1166(+)